MDYVCNGFRAREVDSQDTECGAGKCVKYSFLDGPCWLRSVLAQ